MPSTGVKGIPGKVGLGDLPKSFGTAAGKDVATSAQMQEGNAVNLLPSVAAVMSLFPKREFAENDYIRIPDVPGGLIVQWGTSTAALTTTFPVPFTNYCRQTFQIPQSADTGPHGLIYHRVESKTRFNFTRSPAISSIACYWFAIGY